MLEPINEKKQVPHTYSEVIKNEKNVEIKKETLIPFIRLETGPSDRSIALFINLYAMG